jgi:hypothetical protein
VARSATRSYAVLEDQAQLVAVGGGELVDQVLIFLLEG